MFPSIFIRLAAWVKAVGLALAVASASPAFAAQTVHIYDTEIENLIRSYMEPILKAAGIERGTVRLHLIRSDAPNAFVSRGRRVFLTTGLLRRTTHPRQVIGVLAHETGHIAGGHLARLDTMLRDAQTPVLMSAVIGAVLGTLSGDPGAAVATIGAGQHLAQSQLLSFSRTQERSADRAAVDFLDRSGQSSRGLLEFMETLDEYQSLFVSRKEQQQLSYRVTHPLTRNRIEFLRNHVERSKFSDVPVPAELVAAHKRAIAKLDGFLDLPARTFRKYPASDTSVAARYARAVAHYRQSDFAKALDGISGLIAEFPDDPYFQELKGQILFETGKIADALPYYRRAVEKVPAAPLLRIGLAHVMIETNREALLKPALSHLEEAIRYDDTIALAWRLAATAYGRTGRLPDAALASAEFAMRTGRLDDATLMAERARRGFKEGSAGRLRAEDMLATLKRHKRRQ